MNLLKGNVDGLVGNVPRIILSHDVFFLCRSQETPCAFKLSRAERIANFEAIAVFWRGQIWPRFDRSDGFRWVVEKPKPTGVRRHTVVHDLNLVCAKALEQRFCVKACTASADVDLGPTVSVFGKTLKKLCDRGRASGLASFFIVVIRKNGAYQFTQEKLTDS